MDNKVYTVKEIADMLGIGYGKVINLIKTGDLQAFDTSNKKLVNHRPAWRISQKDFDTFKESRRNG